MSEKDVTLNEIILIGDSDTLGTKAKVVRIYTTKEKQSALTGDIEVIYNQNGLKAVRDDLIWYKNQWTFKTVGVSGLIVGSLDDYPEIK